MHLPGRLLIQWTLKLLQTTTTLLKSPWVSFGDVCFFAFRDVTNSPLVTPTDIASMENKLQSDQYHTIKDFERDAQLIFDNCRTYNDPSTTYVKSAQTN